MDEWRKRLSDRMVEVGVTAAQLTRAAKVGPTMVHDIINRGANPSIQNLSKIAKALGTTVAFLYEGEQDVRHLSISLTGINRGGDMFTSLSGAKGTHIPLDFIDENSVFVRIDTPNFAPRYGQGDIIGGPRMTGQVWDNLIGSEAIICTEHGAQFHSHSDARRQASPLQSPLATPHG